RGGPDPPQDRNGRRAMKSPVVKRSIVIAGHKTSVSLEDAFWNGLKEIAGGRDMTLSDLVAAIDSDRQHGNLSSAIRLFVLDFYLNQLSDHKTAREGPREGLAAPQRPPAAPSAAPRPSFQTRSRTRSAAAGARVAASALGSVRPPPLPAAPAVPAVSARDGFRSLAATPEPIRPAAPPVLAWPRSTLS